MIKGLVTVSTDSEVSLLIEGELPIVGKYYILEDAIHGTSAQRRTREALIAEYWKSGVHPKYGGDGYTDFRDKLKRDMGEGFDKYIYGYIENNKAKTKEVKKKEDIPSYILNDPDMIEIVKGRLKSCTIYTKKQNANFIDNIINDMLANGVNTSKFQQILKGMNHEL
jgi:hypothetical protein